MGGIGRSSTTRLLVSGLAAATVVVAVPAVTQQVAATPSAPIAAAPSPALVAGVQPARLVGGPGDAPKPAGPPQVTELEDLRTERSRTFTTDQPGVLRKEVYAAPVNFRDGNGKWQRIDGALRPVPAGRTRTASSPTPVSIAGSAADEQLASVDLGSGRSVAFGLSGAGAVPAETSDAHAHFPAALPGVDVDLSALPSGVKEDLVLADASRTHFEFPLRLSGVVARGAANGGVELVDDSGSVQAVIPPGEMTDSRRDATHPFGASSKGVRISLDHRGDGDILLVDVDQTWLRDSARVFPVHVDPTIIHTAPNGADDTYVVAFSPGDNSQSTELRAGWGYVPHRSFIRFNQAELAPLASATILSADLNLYEVNAGSCSATELDAYQVTQDWQPNAAPATSWPGPSTGTDLVGQAFDAHGYDASCPAGNLTMPVLPAVQNWASGAWPNYGLMLRAKDESTSAGGYKAFSSTQGSVPPSISVTYHTQNVVPSGTINQDTVWGPDQSPYVLNGPVEVAAGVVLTLLPGTVVKFGTGGGIRAWGTVNSLGTAANPVYFTSLKDDTVGGDTNGDGFHAKGTPGGPAPGDWMMLELRSGNNVVDNTVMRYGGTDYDWYFLPTPTRCQGMLRVANWVRLYLSSSRLEDSCGNGLYAGVSYLQVHNNVFMGNDTTNCPSGTVKGCAAIFAGGPTALDNMIVGNDIDALNGLAYNSQGNGDTGTFLYNHFRRGTSMWYGGGDWRYNWFDNENSGGFGLDFCVGCGSNYPPLQSNYWGHPLDAIGQCYDTYPHKSHPAVHASNGTTACPGGFIDYYLMPASPALAAPPPMSTPGVDQQDHPTFGPVDAATGELTYDASDLAVNDAGQQLKFDRIYKSSYSGDPSPLSGELGTGWQVSYSEKLAPAAAGQANRVTMANGTALDFTIDPTAGLVPTPGNDASFARNGDNSSDLKAPDNSSYHFDAVGNLTSVIQRDPGHQVNIARSAGLVTSVTGVSGRRVDYARSNGKLSSITDTQGRSVQFTYDANGRLATARGVDGQVDAYAYDSATGKLASVTSPSGRVELNVGYDGSGRVAWFEQAGKGRTTVSYHPLERYATFTRADGGVERVDWDGRSRLVHEQMVGERARHVVYDAGGRIGVTFEGMPTQSMVNYAPQSHFTLYDAQGNPVKELDPLGAETNTTFDANHLPLVTTYPSPDGSAAGPTVQRTYDSNRRMTKLIDQSGKRWLAGYNAYGQLVRLADPKSTCDAAHPDDVNYCTTRVRQWQYRTAAAPYGDLQWQRNGAGEQTDYETDAVGRITSTTDPFQRSQVTPKKSTVTYLASGLIDTVTTARGAVTKTYYDADANPVRVEGPEGSVVWYTYDSSGRPWQKIALISAITPVPATPPGCTDSRVACTTVTYDAVGRQQSATDPNGQTFSRTYNFSGLVTEARDPFNARTQATYDAGGRTLTVKQEVTSGVFVTTSNTYDRAGRILSVTHPDSGVDSFTYDFLGRQTAHTSTRGGTWRTSYDNAGRPLVIRDPYDDNGSTLRRTVMSYDDVGNLVTKTDAEGRSVTYTYDDADRATSAVDGTGASMWSAMYTLGRKVSQKDGAGSQTSFAYNDDNQVVTVTDPEGGVTNYTLDLNGRATQVVDANGVTTATDYDKLGRPTETRFADSTKEDLTYDKVNNVLTRLDRAGQTWTKTFDARSRVLTEIDPQAGASHPVTHSYNLAGWETSVTDQTGLVTNFAYDSMGRRNERWTAQNAASHDVWVWDADGQLAASTVAGATQRHYYDLAGYPDYDLDGAGNRTELSTDKTGKVVSVQAPGENPHVKTFDARGRLQSEAIQPVDGTSYTTNFGYDNADHLLTQQWPSGRTDAWDYTKTGLVKAAKVGSTAGAAGPFLITNTYDYYAGGQLKNANLSGGGQFHYDYNATFEQVRAETRPDASVWNFDWAGERLTQTRPPSGVNIVNSYDLDGRLTSQTAGGRTRSFGFDFAGRPTSADNRITGEALATNVKLVVNNKTALTAADTALKNRLQNTVGYTVTLAQASDAESSTGVDLVVIAPSASIGTKYSTATVPVVNLRPGSWTNFKLSSTAATSAAGTNAYVESPTSAIADGPHTKVFGTFGLFSASANEYSVPDSGLGTGAVQVVSRQQTPTDQNVVVAYDKGATLAGAGGAAPARRVGFGVHEDGIAQLTATGWNLFDNAVMWARGTDRQPSGVLLNFGYTNGLLTSATGPNGNVSYSYDNAGRMASMTVDGSTVNYGYSADGRSLLTSVSGAMAATIDYDAAGRMDWMASGQAREDFTFDKASRPTGATLKVNGAQQWASALTYKPDGQIATRSQSVVNAANAFTDTFAYDAAGRLDTMQRVKGSPVTATVNLDVDYDARGNRSKVAVSGLTNTGADDPTSAAAFGVAGNGSVTYTYNTAGRLTGASDGSTYAYDADGRMKDTTTPAEGRRVYGYDPFGDLLSVDKGSVVTRLETVTRDAFGRIATRSQAGRAYSTFAYDGTGGAVVSFNDRAVSWGKATTVRTPGGYLVGTVDPVNGSQLAAADVHGDLGAVAPTDAAKGSAASATVSYSPFGVPTRVGRVPVPLGFQSQVQDPGSNLVDMGARVFNPVSGGFVQADSFAGRVRDPMSLNRYSYGEGDPVTASDPSGHSVFDALRRAGEHVAAQRTAAEWKAAFGYASAKKNAEWRAAFGYAKAKQDTEWAAARYASFVAEHPGAPAVDHNALSDQEAQLLKVWTEEYRGQFNEMPAGWITASKQGQLDTLLLSMLGAANLVDGSGFMSMDHAARLAYFNAHASEVEHVVCNGAVVRTFCENRSAWIGGITAVAVGLVAAPLLAPLGASAATALGLAEGSLAATAVGGTVVGATTGFVADSASQVMTTGKVDLKQAGKAAIIGGVLGGPLAVAGEVLSAAAKPILGRVGRLLGSSGASAEGAESVTAAETASATKGPGLFQRFDAWRERTGALTGDTGAVDPTEIRISRSRYPESAQHIEDAQAAGKPTELTIDRGGAAARRAESMRGNPRQPGLDRDEYPPAMFEEGGTGSSVRGIDPSDNRGAGSSIGNQCRGLPNGSVVRLVIGC